MENDPLDGFVPLTCLLAAAAGVVTGALVTIGLYLNATNDPTLSGIASVFAIGLLYSLVPGGIFGLVAGIPGAMWLLYRRRSLRTPRAVSLEGAIGGLVIGLCFSPVRQLLWAPPGGLSLTGFALAGASGAICGAVLGRVLASRLLSQS